MPVQSCCESLDILVGVTFLCISSLNGHVLGADDAAQGLSQGNHTAARGRGSQRGGNQRGDRSNEQRDHRHKDMHKAAVANHHRKDRALRKQGGPAV